MKYMPTETAFKYLNEVRFMSLSNWSVGAILSNKVLYKDGFKLEPIGNLIIRNREKEILEDDKAYKQVTIKLYGKGVVQRGDELIFGKDIGTKNQFRVSEGQFIMSRIDARNGAFGIVPAELEGAITTQDFLSYNINTEKILPEFFNLITGTKHFAELCQKASSGTTGRQRVDEKAFLGFRIPVPNIDKQKVIINEHKKLINEAITFEEKAKDLDNQKDTYLINELGLRQTGANKSKERFYTINFENLGRWDVWNSSVSFQATKYKFQEFSSVILGKPKYGANTKSVLKKSDVRYIRSIQTPAKDELVVGVGAFKNLDSGVRYIGSAFSFQNNGQFNEFDCFLSSDTDVLAGAIQDAVVRYASVNNNPQRLFIHFYKTMSRAEMTPILQKLHNLGLPIPVFIVSINKTESSDIIAWDSDWNNLMPYSGTFVKIGKNRYLLFNNTRYETIEHKASDGYPFPVKLQLSCTQEELLEGNTVRDLIDQVYQFSRMYWKSVKQQHLPVTIKYPEMVAEIFPHFEGQDLPDFGKDKLWFL